jgi:hypothetical protein
VITVTYAGWTVYEGEDPDAAYEAYLEAGPYGRIWEDE